MKALVLRPTRSLSFTISLLLLAAVLPARADLNWDGDNPVGNFSYCNNWYSDACPHGGGVGSSTWTFSDGNLVFNYRNSSSQTSLYYDLGWNNINDIIWETTFGAGLPLNGGGNGINFNQRVENRSSFGQTVNIPLSAAKNGATQIELNPVNGDLTISGSVFNDNNKPFYSFGSNSKMLTVGVGLTGNTSVGFTIAAGGGGGYGKVKFTAAQTWGDATHGLNVNQGELWIDSGGSLQTGIPVSLGLADANTAKFWLSASGGGVTVGNSITVANSGGTKTLGGLNTSGANTFSGTVTLNGPVSLEANQSGGTVGFSGVISGGGANTVSLPGPGTVRLSAVNSYSGATAVNGGKLVGVTGGSCANSAVTVASGATLGVEVATAGGQWTCSSLTFNTTTTTLDLQFAGASTVTAPLLVSGTLTANGTISITVRGGTFAAGSTYPLAKYTTLVGTGFAAFSLASTPSGVTAHLNNNTANKTIDLVIDSSTQPLTWTAGTGTWDINITPNWKDSSGAATTYQETSLPGNAVLFDDTPSGAGPFTVTLGTVVTPASVTFNDPTKNYTLSGSGSFSGGGGLVKSSAGTLTLSLANNNTWNGATTVGGGTLTLDYSSQNNSKLSDTGVLVLGGGTLSLSGGSHTEVVASATTASGGSFVTRSGGTGILQMNTLTHNIGGTVDFGAAGIAQTSTANDAGGILGGWATVAGADWATRAAGAGNQSINALGSYTTDPGTWTGLSTANVLLDSTASALTTPNSAVVLNSLKFTAAKTLTIGSSSGATLQINDGILVAGAITAALTTGSSGRNLIGPANADLVINIPNSSGILNISAFSATIADNAGTGTALTLSGAGTLNLTLGVNAAYTGATTINGGKLVAGGTHFDIGGGNVVVNPTATLDFTGASDDKCITTTASLTVNGGSVNLESHSQTVNSLVVQNNASITGFLSGKKLTIGSTAANAIDAQSGSIDVVLASTSGGLTKTTLGTVTLTRANTFAGNTTISAGTLALGLSTAVAKSPTVSIASGATLDVSAAGAAIVGSSPVQTLAASSSSGSAAVNATGQTLTLNSGALLSFQAVGGGSPTVGKISVTGNLTLNANAVTVNVTGSPLSSGTYRLMDCTGTVTGTGGAATVAGAGMVPGATASISVTTGAAGHVDLVVTARVTWDSDANSANGATDGSGTWDTVTANWYNGSADVVWPNTINTVATIGAASGAAGIISVSGTITLNAITNSAAGSGSYTLSGGTLNFGGPTPTISIAALQTPTINSVIGESSAGTAMRFTGTSGSSGSITLGGANTFTGAATNSQVTVSFNSLANGGVASSFGKGANTVPVIVCDSGSTATATYTGAAASTDRPWTVNGTANNGGNIKSSGTGAISFNNTGSAVGGTAGARLVALGGTYTASANTFAELINDMPGFATTNQVTGNTWNITGANTHSGGTILGTSGVLNIANASALGTGPLTISGNGSFDNTTAGDITVANAFTLSGGSPIYFGSLHNMTINGAVTLSGANRTLTVNANTLALGGAIGDSGQGRSLTKAGNGTLSLGGASASTYTGGTTLSAGMLQIAGSATLGASGSPLTVSGGTLDLGATTQTLGAVTNSGTATVQNGTINGSSFWGTLGSGTATVSATLAGAAATLTQSGAGTLTLSSGSGNTYGGGTTISAGTVSISAAKELGTATGTSFLNFTGNGTLLATAGLTLPSSGTITVNNTFTANFDNTTVAGAGSTFEIASKITGAGAVKRASESSFANGAIRFSNDANDYSGGFSQGFGATEFTSVANGGFPSALGAASSVYTVGNQNSAAILRYVGSGNSSTTRNIDWQGTLTTGLLTLDSSGAGSVQFVGANNLKSGSGGTAGLILRGSSTGNNTLAQVVNDVGGATTLTKFDAGTWILTGANTYTGPTTNSGGILSINSIQDVNSATPNSLGEPTTAASGTIEIGSATTSATLAYTGSGHSSDRVINLAGTTGGATIDASGTGPLALTSAFTATGAGSKTLTLQGSSTAANSVAVVVDNSGVNTTSLTKSGTGEWILTGINTYTGPTTISGGTLLVNGSTSSGSTVTVSSGTLGGNGTIGGPTVVQAGGTLSPGASIGTLHFNTAPTLAGTNLMEIDKTSIPVNDQIVVNTSGGTLTFGGVLSISALNGTTFALGDAFSLFVGASDASPKFAGSFTSISPATPGAGLAWDTSTLTSDGTLRVTCSGTLSATAGVITTPICSGSTLSLTNSATGGSGTGYTYSWTGPNGFSSLLQNPTIPNATTAASGTYNLVVGDSVSCSAATNVVVTVNGAPIATAGGPQTVCNNTTVSLSGSVLNATGGHWTTSGDGSFGNADALSTTYTPGPTDISHGSVTLTLTTAGEMPPCMHVADSALITLQTCCTTPVVTTDTTNQTVCLGSQVTWSVAATGTSLTYQWQRDGTNLVAGLGNFLSTTNASLTNSAIALQDGVTVAHGYACLIASGTCTTNSTAVSLSFDTTQPTINCPGYVLVACGASTDPAQTGTATASDDHDPNPVITHTDTPRPVSCTGLAGIDRTWVATDACGNSATCVQPIDFADSTPPTITCPPPVTVSCVADVPPADFAGGTVSDNCPATVHVALWTEVITEQTCPNRYTIARTYLAQDACGNTAACTQTIKVDDETGPVLTVSVGALSACHADNPAAIADVLAHSSATDGCDGAVTPTAAVTGGTACNPEITVTAVDSCGNTSTQVVTVHVDGTAPALTVNCAGLSACHVDNAAAIADVVAHSSAIDNCDGAVTPTAVVTGGTACNPEITVTAADSCGNTSTQVCTAHVDAGAPVVHCPADKVLACGDSTAPGNTGTATATDNCDANPAISYSDAATAAGCAGAAGIDRTWTATDACGNSASCVQHITFEDHIAPTVHCPADKVLACGDSIDPSNTGTATATDNCGASPAVGYSDAATAAGCAGIAGIDRTWTATDACGNSSACVQHITFEDHVNPVVHCPADKVLACGDSTDPSNTGTATATDNCGANPAVSYGDAATAAGCAGIAGIDRTWTATDACGNSASCVQHITFEDHIAPTVHCPADKVLACGDSTDPSNTGTATATDNCDANPAISYNDAATAAGCAGAAGIDRTWTAMDACGNSASCVQHITFEDHIAPAVHCPADQVLACGASTDPSNTGTATATDNCGATPAITHSDAFIAANCTGNQGIDRTWVATDACGNSSACVQHITFADSAPPSIQCPAAVTVSCAGAVPPTDFAGGSTSDNCLGTVNVAWVSDAISAQTCANRYTITRTYKATDACGNTATCAQIIKVDDETPPTITHCAPDQTVECASLVPAANDAAVSATDNCGGTVTVTHDADVITPGACANRFTIARTYHATDACGNHSECVQHITVLDDTAPVITQCAPDQTVECASLVPGANDALVSATDNCGGTVTVTHDADVITTGTCPNRYTIARTYHAIDSCGNSSSCVQHITVHDDIAPLITQCAGDVAVECPSAVPGPDDAAVLATDNCGGTVTVTHDADAIVLGDCPNHFVIHRTYHATDACGNHSECVQTITVHDDTVPSITAGSIAACYPTQAAAETAAKAATSASDNCGGTPVLSASTVGSCSATITVTATDGCGNHASVNYGTQIIGPPTFPSITAFENTTVDVKNCANITVQGTVNISVAATNPCGLLGVPTVWLTNGVTAESATYDSETPPGTFNYHWDVTAATSNGTWQVTITAADTCQSASAQFNLCMNAAQLTGQVQMEGFVGAGTPTPHTRTVMFVATDLPGTNATVLKTWTLDLSNVSGDTFAYSLSDVPPGLHYLSAKTAYSLRSKIPVTLDLNGQASGVNFTGIHRLRGGDFTDDNTINLDDYFVLANNFFTYTSAGDITGDGAVDFDDYVGLATNWFTQGDPP